MHKEEGGGGGGGSEQPIKKVTRVGYFRAKLKYKSPPGRGI